MDRPQRLLFPTDFSKASAQALPYAVQLARGFDADLYVLHVEELHDLHDRFEGSPAAADVLQALERETGPMIDHLFEELGEDLDDRGVLLHRARRRGLAAGPEILDYAQENEIDLIVMATHGRTGLAHFFGGSTAESVANHSNIPIVTFKLQEELEPA